MVRRTLGRTGLSVSPISLGTVELGMDYGISDGGHVRPAETDAIRVVHAALDAGINFIDTARGYGEAEAVLGKALAGKREGVVIASKVTAPTEGRDDEIAGKVAQSIETTLRTLRIDHVDVMYIHNTTLPVLERNVVFESLQKAQLAGKLRWIAASTYGEAAANAAIAHGGFDCIQVAFNALDRGLGKTAVPDASNAGMGIVIRSVLLKGVLTYRAPLLPDAMGELRDAASRLSKIAAGAGISLPEMAYRYVLHNPLVSSALVGTAHAEEAQQAVQFASAPPLSKDVITQIEKIELSDPMLANPSTWPPV